MNNSGEAVWGLGEDYGNLLFVYSRCRLMREEGRTGEAESNWRIASERFVAEKGSTPEDFRALGLIVHGDYESIKKQVDSSE